MEKIGHILSQTDKFECLGDVETNDKTILRERALQAFLLRYKKAGFVSQEVCAGRLDVADLVCMAYSKHTSRRCRLG